MNEKRKNERVLKSIKCEVTSDSFTFSSTVDVSPGGLFIATPEPPAEKTKVSLLMYLENGSHAEVEAVVKWTRDEEPDGTKAGMGVEFIDAPDDVMEEVLSVR